MKGSNRKMVGANIRLWRETRITKMFLLCHVLEFYPGPGCYLADDSTTTRNGQWQNLHKRPDTKQNILLTQKECTVANKTLGVYKTAVGDDTKQFKELLHKNQKLAQLASTAKMTRHQGRLAYNMIYIPTITYSLVACTFSKTQLDQIQAPALYKFLPAMGWNRTTSRAIIHGPEDFGGFNIPPLYTIQGASKIISIFTNIQA